MRVNTKAYGMIDLDHRQNIEFPLGLLGFENYHDFFLLDAAQPPFYWLQSKDVREIAFVLIDPFIFRPDYSPGIAEEELEEIEVEAEEDILIFSIVTIPGDHTRMTANLQGPLIVNKKKRLGKQVISPDTRWKVRHFIIEELSGENQC